jgi:hypothetical protein
VPLASRAILWPGTESSREIVNFHDDHVRAAALQANNITWFELAFCHGMPSNGGFVG